MFGELLCLIIDMIEVRDKKIV